MPCCLAIFALAAPRVVIALLFLFSRYLHDAYDTAIWPIVGFLFLPTTTLAYALAVNQVGGVTGLYLVLVVIAVLIDLGSYGYGVNRRGRSKS